MNSGESRRVPCQGVYSRKYAMLIDVVVAQLLQSYGEKGVITTQFIPV